MRRGATYGSNRDIGSGSDDSETPLAGSDRANTTVEARETAQKQAIERRSAGEDRCGAKEEVGRISVKQENIRWRDYFNSVKACR